MTLRKVKALGLFAHHEREAARAIMTARVEARKREGI
jgi:hypothetical protein